MPVTAWEYRLAWAPDSTGLNSTGTEELLNDLGSQGWELVAVFDHWMFLKRPSTTAGQEAVS